MGGSLSMHFILPLRPTLQQLRLEFAKMLAHACLLTMLAMLAMLAMPHLLSFGVFEHDSRSII